MSTPLIVLVAHPFPDLYGADLMLLSSLTALTASGCQVVLVVPEDGPLLPRLTELGLKHVVVPFPVLRKDLMYPRGVVRLARTSLSDLPGMKAVIRDVRPDVVYVNTLTIPLWLWAARRTGLPGVCHVRELESETSRPVRAALTAPLRLARTVIANSQATRKFVVDGQPGIARRTRVIYNGFRFPHPPGPASDEQTPRTRLTVVGRLSPRKGQDVAVRALARLVAEGRDIDLRLVGSTFTGYEWFERDLRSLAQDLGVADRLELAGYHADVWPELCAADVVLVPSRLEPFGSVAVEALAASRPVVVSDVGGLPEIVRHRRTGLVVPADDVEALSAAVAELLDDPATARGWADAGRRDALDRFALERYERELEATLRSAAGSSG